MRKKKTMICIAFLKRDILHAGTFREDESIGLSLRRDFGFVIMQTITWEKKSLYTLSTRLQTFLRR